VIVVGVGFSHLKQFATQAAAIALLRENRKKRIFAEAIAALELVITMVGATFGVFFLAVIGSAPFYALFAPCAMTGMAVAVAPVSGASVFSELDKRFPLVATGALSQSSIE
jgi:hypothetical protein